VLSRESWSAGGCMVVNEGKAKRGKEKGRKIEILALAL
jgi:hypothetical protein